MKMYYLFIATLFAGCTGKQIPLLNKTSELALRNDCVSSVANTKFNPCKSNDCIPKSFIRQLRRENRRGFQMAGPNDIYNDSDFEVIGVPDKRLILAGASDDQNLIFTLFESKDQLHAGFFVRTMDDIVFTT